MTTSANRPVRARKSVTHYSDDNPSTFTIKRRKGDEEEVESPPRPSPSKKMDAARIPPAAKKRKKTVTVVEEPKSTPPSSSSPVRRKRKLLPLASTTTTVGDTMLAHAVAVRPLWPVPGDEALAAKWSLSPPPAPQATLVNMPTRHAPSHALLKSDPPLTVWKARDDHAEFGVAGDAVGGVVLYRLQPRLSSLKRLSTLASQREAERHVTLARTIAYPHAIMDAAWYGNKVAVRSAMEVECIDTETDQCLWTLPLASSSSKLELSWEPPLANRLALTSDAGPDGPGLYLVDEKGQAQKTVVGSGTVTAVLWDQVVEDCLLVVVVDQASVELVRYQVGTAAIVTRASLPTLTGRGSAFDCRLQQHHGPRYGVGAMATTHPYTFLSTSRGGIRLYDTPSLTCLQVFGDTVALHGKHVQWQSCWWLPQPTAEDQIVVKNKRTAWLEREDEVRRRQSHGSTEFLLLGVPAAGKEPAELQSTLYVWQAGQPAQPLTTIAAPHGGILGLTVLADPSGWRLLSVSAEFGTPMETAPVLRSDFAGVQYPVGYKVIDDNIEYIEDEDELDQAVVAVEEGEDESAALQRIQAPVESTTTELDNVLRHVKEDQKEDETVHVLVDDHEEDYFATSMVVPCRPQVNLAASEDGQDSPSSPVRTASFDEEAECLTLLPQYKTARMEIRQYQERRASLSETQSDVASEVGETAGMVTRPKSKRSRTANIEALLQSCIDPNLRAKMSMLSKAWADGRGSTAQLEAPTSSSTTVDKGPEVEQQQQHSKPVDASQSPPRIESTAKAIQNGDTARRMFTPERERRSPSISSKVSAEEKELALELLLLSPANGSAEKKPPLRQPDLERETAPPPAAAKKDDDGVVTPPEQSPGLVHAAPEAPSPSRPISSSVIVTCPACRGRMVLHICGKREKPIDYDAIERAERERKEREEAEKQRLRIEKRRAADARRREARRKRKEEEERKRREEEERMRRLEADHFEQANIREHEDEPVEDRRLTNGYSGWPRDSYRPSFSPMKGHSKQTATHAFGRSEPMAREDVPYYRQPDNVSYGAHHSWNPGPRYTDHEHRGSEHQYEREETPYSAYRSEHSSYGTDGSIRINGTEIKPSAALSRSDADALEALAGLANSLAAAPTSSTHAFDSSSGDGHNGYWKSNEWRTQAEQASDQADGHYDEGQRSYAEYDQHATNDGDEAAPRAADEKLPQPVAEPTPADEEAKDSLDSAYAQTETIGEVAYVSQAPTGPATLVAAASEEPSYKSENVALPETTQMSEGTGGHADATTNGTAVASEAVDRP